MDHNERDVAGGQLAKISRRKPEPNLERYTTDGFSRGRSMFVFALWIIVDAVFVSSWVPGSPHRRWLLRAFGARIGRGVVIKPRVRVKYPWRLTVGDHCWIGESVWIDNLDVVTIGTNACLSQGAYICTGSHDWSRSTFDLRTEAVTIDDGAWIAAKAIVGPGVSVGAGAVLGLGSVATSDLAPWAVHRGNPARYVRSRA